MDKIIFIKNQVKNVHDSQKWMWSVLAGFSMFNATKILIENSGENFLFTLTCYLIFLLFLFRFYVGDNRILDYYYDSIPCALNDNVFWEYIKTLPPKNIAIDSIIRVVQYFFIVAAAINLDNIERFVGCLAFLLFINSLYSFIILKFIDTNSDSIIKKHLKKNIDFETYRKIWKLNNILSFIFISLWFYFYKSYDFLLLLLFINSIIDMYFCKEVYFPNYYDFHKE